MSSYIIDFDQPLETALGQLAVQRGCSKEEVIKRAFLTYKVVSELMSADTTLAIADKQGNVQKTLLLY